MLDANMTLNAVTSTTAVHAPLPDGTRFVLSIAPKGHVPEATHCLYVPLPLDAFEPELGSTITLTPDGGFVQTFRIIQIDPAPGDLAHCAVWLNSNI